MGFNSGFKGLKHITYCRQNVFLTFIWHSWDRAPWHISIVKATSCTIFEFIEYHSTCFVRSFRPSSRVQDCTHSIRYVIQVSWLLASGHEVPASKQSTNLYETYLMLCVQSWTPDDGRKDRPKHVEWYSINSKIVQLVAFTIEIQQNICVSLTTEECRKWWY